MNKYNHTDTGRKKNEEQERKLIFFFFFFFFTWVFRRCVRPHADHTLLQHKSPAVQSTQPELPGQELWKHPWLFVHRHQRIPFKKKKKKKKTRSYLFINLLFFFLFFENRSNSLSSSSSLSISLCSLFNSFVIVWTHVGDSTTRTSLCVCVCQKHYKSKISIYY